jgi:hypothetical protein
LKRYEQSQMHQKNESREVIELENTIAESILQYTILLLLSQESSLDKERIYEIIKAKSGGALDIATINNALDILYFNELIISKYPYKKCIFSLTKQGLKRLNAYGEKKQEIIRFIKTLFNSQ